MNYARSYKWRTSFAFMLAAVQIGFCLRASAALAVEWYPSECRRESHCAEVMEITYAQHAPAPGAASILTVRTRRGTAFVPRELPRRVSIDGEAHACMRPEQEGMELTCLFVPPEPNNSGENSNGN